MKNIRFFLIVSGWLLAAAFWLSLPDGKTRVIFCDVGQGDGVVVSQGTFEMVYDVGPGNKKMRRCLERYMPFWDRSLEVVVISHWDKDHSGGLTEIVKGYRIEKLYSGVEPEGQIEQKIYTGSLGRNDVLVYKDIRFEVVWPEEISGEDNEDSVVGLLNYKDKKVLLMGDAPVEVEQRLVWRKILEGRVDVLKVGHHGAKTSTSRELVEEVRPQLAVIGVGRNSFGHPSREVIDRLEKWGVEVKRTDKDGDVVVRLD